MRTLAQGLLRHSPNLRLRFILENASFRALYICATTPGADPAEGDRPPKTYESNFFHHDFEQFGKHHSQYKAIFRPFFVTKVLWRILHLSYGNEPVIRLDFQILLISLPPYPLNLQADPPLHHPQSHFTKLSRALFNVGLSLFIYFHCPIIIMKAHLTHRRSLSFVHVVFV